MSTNLIIILSLAIPTYFLWAVIHEMSHVIAYHLISRVLTWKIKPYPHMYQGTIRFASYTVWCDGVDKEDVWKHTLAPRVMDIVACILFPLCTLLSGYAEIVCLTLCAGGVLDMFVGSLGIRRRSDLRVASDSLDIPYNVLRAAGMAIVDSSILLTGVLYL